METLNDTMEENKTLVCMKEDEMSHILSPVVAFVAILMTSGAIGNSLVCYICYRKWKEKKIKYFIGFLASFDLLTSCICMPMEIAMLRHPIGRESDALCKIQRFSRALTSLAAGSMLVIIAFDRYLSICRHTLTRITSSQARWLCCVCFMFSLVFSWPTLMLFGETEPETLIIAETSCSTAPEYSDTSYPKIYYWIICLLFFGISSSLVVFYTLIWIRVLRLPNLTSTNAKRSSYTASLELSSFSQSKSKGEKETDTKGIILRDYKKNDPSLSQNYENDPIVKQKPKTTQVNKSEDKFKAEESEDSCDFLTESSRNSTIDRKEKRRPLTSRNNNVTKMKPERISRFSILRKMSFSSSTSTPSRNMLRRKRITITMFIITTVQVISFIPYMSLLISRNTMPDFLKCISVPLQVAYNVAILSHFISSGVNPFVYGFCTKIFRREFRKVFCKSK